MTEKKIIEEVIKFHPEMEGVKPSFREVKVKLNKRLQKKLKVKFPEDKVNTLKIYTFTKNIITESGVEIDRIVRVTVNRKGEIIKMVSSK